MNVYEFSRYRKAFGAIFERERKLKAGAWSLAQLANAVRMQPSYLTNVVKERAHFSADQIHAVGERLGLSVGEIDFLTLLMEQERADHSGRRARLGEAVEKARRENLRAEKFLSAPENRLKDDVRDHYYLDPNIELIHLYLGTKRVPAKAAEIARIWAMPEAYVAEILAFLQKNGLARFRGGRWERESINHHLPRESPLCRPQQMLKRLRALEAVQRLSGDAAYTFSASVTMSREARLEIQARFLAFLKECEAAVKGSEPDAVYQIQFDLFPWLASQSSQ